MSQDVTQELSDVENSLRDLIEVKLSDRFGKDWLEKSGITAEKILNLESKRKEEAKRQKIGSASEGFLYYAELHDLKEIIIKNWQNDFLDIFGDKKQFEVFFEQIESFRITDAHRRELLPYQKNLLLGIAGQLRSQVIVSRNKMVNRNDVFPRIEIVRDNLGNLVKGDSSICNTKMTLYPGDKLSFVVTAYDPEGLDLKYGIHKTSELVPQWKSNNPSNVFSLFITESDISEIFIVALSILSTRKYHAHTSSDDEARFMYRVFPKRAK